MISLLLGPITLLLLRERWVRALPRLVRRRSRPILWFVLCSRRNKALRKQAVFFGGTNKLVAPVCVYVNKGTLRAYDASASTCTSTMVFVCKHEMWQAIRPCGGTAQVRWCRRCRRSHQLIDVRMISAFLLCLVLLFPINSLSPVEIDWAAEAVIASFPS